MPDPFPVPVPPASRPSTSSSASSASFSSLASAFTTRRQRRQTRPRPRSSPSPKLELFLLPTVLPHSSTLDRKANGEISSLHLDIDTVYNCHPIQPFVYCGRSHHPRIPHHCICLSCSPSYHRHPSSGHGFSQSRYGVCSKRPCILLPVPIPHYFHRKSSSLSNIQHKS